jgi:transposase InsO family protein
MLGGTLKGFCRVLAQTRSKLYNWLVREKTGRLEDAKPVAHDLHWRLGAEKIKEVLAVLEEYPEIATDYAAAIKTGLSAGSVNKIKKMNQVKPMAAVRPVVKQSYHWMKRNVCWSMDTMMIRFMGGWLYALLVVEETSRMILGYKLVEEKLGIYARELLLTTIALMKVKPLVLKHDRGSEFENGYFLGALRDNKIVSLPSPGYYAPFNSIMERSNRIIRRFTAPLEARYDAAAWEIEAALARGQRVINHELPRRIFDGKTSRQIYREGRDYENSERMELINLMLDDQEEVDGKYFLRGKELDKQRKEVVEYLCQKNLCDIRYRVQFQKLIG